MLAIFQQIGPPEIILILLVALLLFGAKRLPDIGKGLGKGIKEFKSGVKGLNDDVKTGLEGEDTPTRTETRKDAAD